MATRRSGGREWYTNEAGELYQVRRIPGSPARLVDRLVEDSLSPSGYWITWQRIVAVNDDIEAIRAAKAEVRASAGEEKNV